MIRAIQNAQSENESEQDQAVIENAEANRNNLSAALPFTKRQSKPNHPPAEIYGNDKSSKKIRYRLTDFLSLAAGLVALASAMVGAHLVLYRANMLTERVLGSFNFPMTYLFAFLAGCVAFVFGSFAAQLLVIPYSKFVHRTKGDWKHPLVKSQYLSPSAIDGNGCCFLIIASGVVSAVAWHFLDEYSAVIAICFALPAFIVVGNFMFIQERYSSK